MAMRMPPIFFHKNKMKELTASEIVCVCVLERERETWIKRGWPVPSKFSHSETDERRRKINSQKQFFFFKRHRNKNNS